MAWLLNPATGEREYLAERSIVGRAEHCWIHIPHSSVSKEHAVLYFDNEAWLVRDLGSRNGTWANGARVDPGASVSVGRESSLQFGDINAVLATIDPPTLCVRRASGSCLVAEGGVVILPDAERPLASVYEKVPGHWVLDAAGEERAVHDGDTFYVGEERFRVHVPSAGSRKAFQSTQQSLGQLSLGELQLVLEVSSDGESIVTRLEGIARPVELPPRTSHQLLLLLARQRVQDQEAGIADPECGWLYSDDFAKMLGFDRERVNVDIHRLRQQFAVAGVMDASRVIERRPTSHQLRLGIRRAVIR
jgi:hypothetical protein